MRRGRSTGKPTKAEEAHIDAVKRAGCLCCIALGYPHDPDGPMVEAHHLLSGGIRRGHGFIVGLCPHHHRNQPFVQGWSYAQHREKLGPSLLNEAEAFHAEFGSDEELLEKQETALQK